MSQNEVVLQEVSEGVGIATLNRPDKFNCLSTAVIAGLGAAFDRFEADRAVRAVVLAANGANFCTGADLDEVLQARASRETVALFLGRGHRLMRRIEASPLPVIAGVQGLCLAGGLELMMAADVVLADPAARIGCQHARYGLVPGFGGTQRLPRRIGLNRALELMFSARWLKAEEALAWGLVNQLSNPGGAAQAAREFAAKIARSSRSGLATMKRLARQGLEGSLDQGLRLEETQAADALLSEDIEEGLTAFQQRREPIFR